MDMPQRPQDRMMGARGEPQGPEEPANPLEMLDGLTPDMINGMTEQDAKGILTQLVSTMKPEGQTPAPAPQAPPAPPMQ